MSRSVSDLLASLSPPSASRPAPRLPSLPIGTSFLTSGGGAPKARLVLVPATGFAELCRHTIGMPKEGSFARLCLRQREPGKSSCGTKHQGSERLLMPDFVYIVNSKEQMHEKPCFSSASISQVFLESLLDKRFGLTELNSLVYDIQAASSELTYPLEATDLSQWRQKLSEPLRTPKRNPLPTEREGNAPPRWDTPDVALHIEEDPDLERESTASLSTVRQLRHLRDAVHRNSSAMLGMHRDWAGHQELLTEDLRVLDVRTQALETTLGSPREIGAAPTAASLWEVMEVLDTSTLSTETSTLRAEVEELKAQLATTQAARQESESKVGQLETQLARTLEIVVDLMAQVGEVKRLADRSEEGKTTGNTLESLRRDVDALKRNVSASGAVQAFSELIPGINTTADVEKWLLEQYEIGAVVDEDSPDPPSYGGFCDIYVFLAAAMEFNAIETKGDTLKEIDQMRKAELHHPAEALVLYALKRPLPGIFGQGLGMTGSSYLQALPEASAWDRAFAASSSDKPGMKDLLHERHEHLESSIRGAIFDLYSARGHDKIAELAREMLAATVKLLAVLTEYISSVFRNLTQRSGFNEADAWSLTTQVVRGMFLHMSTVRSEARMINPKAKPLKVTSQILYTILRTHDVMNEFVQAEIKNHSTVSSEYVKFLATHSSAGEVRALKQELEAVKVAAKSAQAEAIKALNATKAGNAKKGNKRDDG